MEWFWDQYIGAYKDGLSPYASLLRATSLSGLPDATAVTAKCDPLLDEGVDYAHAIEAAGAKTAYRTDSLIQTHIGSCNMRVISDTNRKRLIAISGSPFYRRWLCNV